MKRFALMMTLFCGFQIIAYAETLTPNDSANGTVGKRDWIHYQIPLSNDQQKLTITLSGMSADGDLYVRMNNTPSRWFGRWDCRPYASGSKTEQCHVNNDGNSTLNVSIYGARATEYKLTISATQRQPETVYLLLHGLNSSPDTWNEVVDDIFHGQCPELKGDSRDLELNAGKCYRYHFATRSDQQNQFWENGDGSTYDQLGQEVGLALKSIQEVANPPSVVVVGHSRGGLSARAHLQSLNQPYPFQVGLLTVGTPHQGSPFGLIKHWMEKEGYHRDDVWISALHFVFSPSVGFLASVLDDNGLPTIDPFSEAINQLNANIGALSNNVDSFGQITSDGLELGENAAGYLDLLYGARAAMILPGDLSEMRDFVLKNVQREGWETGDGIVPHESQQMNKIPGFSTNGAGLWHGQLTDISHADATLFDFWDSNPNDGETGQISLIYQVLQKMTESTGFTPLVK